MHALDRRATGVPYVAAALLLGFAAGCSGGGDGGPECVPSTEVCNGIDDDCDGGVDEGNPGGGAGCTTGLQGACAAGTLRCTDGSVQCAQTTAASAELCNGVDDDCDGVVDQGDPGGGGACQTGLLGACAAGVEHCLGGSIQCVQAFAAGAETCNGKDDDCNGAVDDGNPGGGVACSTGLLGVCAAGTTACANGAIRCDASIAASAEVCNGLDDDCDGTVDNGNPGGGVACSTGLQGICAAGTTVCTGGELRCAQSALATSEVCNGLDDDCDGVVDDGNPGGGVACTTGLPGICSAGATVCTGGGIECQQATPAQVELCNGVDDDCDGTVDDGFDVGAACTAGVGACAVTGARVCKQDGTGTVCDAVPSAPGTELCGNGVDDDCDGAVDEGCPYAHTIAIDGTNDFAAPAERFATTSAGYSAYVSWDAGYLYVGYEGPDVATTDVAKWLLVYLDDRSGGLATGQTYGTQRVSFAAPFLADHEVALRLGDGYLAPREVRGSSWAGWTPSPVLTWARSGTYVELAVPFAALGDPGAVGVTAVLLNERAGQEWTYAGLYPDAFSDGLGPTVTKYLFVNRASVAAPNDPANVGPSCADGRRNGSETDVDCGGACGACADGKSCSAGSDCRSLVCGANRTCLSPTCSDLVKNGNETDVDCGGSCATKCGLSKGCAAPADCASAACAGSACVAKTCSALHQMNPAAGTGPYTIAPDGTTGYTVYCEMTIQGGGWTIVSINGLMDAASACEFRLASDAPGCGTVPSFTSDWQLPGSAMNAIPFREIFFGVNTPSTSGTTGRITLPATTTVGAGTFTGTADNPTASRLWCLAAPAVGTYGVTVDPSGYTVFGPVLSGSGCSHDIAYDLGMNPPKSSGTRQPGWGGDAPPICGCADGQATGTGNTSAGWFGLR